MQVRSGTCSTTPSSCHQPVVGTVGAFHTWIVILLFTLFSRIPSVPNLLLLLPFVADCQKVVQFHSNPPRNTPPPYSSMSSSSSSSYQNGKRTPASLGFGIAEAVEHTIFDSRRLRLMAFTCHPGTFGRR